MLYAKCIELSNNQCELIYGDEHTEYIDTQQLLQNIKNKKINVINLIINNKNELSYTTDIKSIIQYKFLSTNSITDEVRKVYDKINLLGFNKNQQDKKQNNNIITDLNNKIDEAIYANTVTFIGNNKLEQKDKRPIEDKHILISDPKGNIILSGYNIIFCKRAVILNKCIMSCLITNNINSDIVIEAPYIKISHNFIDINTMYELYSILNNINLKSTLLGDGYYRIIEIDFEKCGVNKEELFNNSKIIVETVISNLNDKNETKNQFDKFMDHTNLVHTLHFLCCMYASTKDKRYLDLAKEIDNHVKNKTDLKSKSYYWQIKAIYTDLILNEYAKDN